MKKLVLLSALGLLAALAGAAVLTGCNAQHAESTSQTADAVHATTADAPQSEVAIEVTDAGFVPETVTIPKGEPATLVVTRKTDATCATAMVFAETGEKYELPLNETIRIQLAANHPETLDYACPMDMIKGKIVSK